MFEAITAQNLVAGWHCDTYGIALGVPKSIRHVSDDTKRADYHCGMDKTPNPWLDWGNRFRTQIKEKGKSLAQVAAMMTPPDAAEPLAESTLRSWTNGSRQINLADFFWLCEAADVDPAMVLFGRPIMTEVQRKALGDLTASMMESDPTASPNYEKFGEKVRKSVRAHKAAEARANSRLKT